MSVVCAACAAENRNAAKFCKGCGTKLALSAPIRTPVSEPNDEAAWPATAPAPLARAPELAVGVFDPTAPAPAPHPRPEPASEREDATVIMRGAAGRGPTASAPVPPPAALRDPVPIRPQSARQSPSSSRLSSSRTRGNRSKALGVGFSVLVVGLAAGGAWWYAVRGDNTPPPVEAAASVPAVAKPAPAAIAEPAAVATPPAPAAVATAPAPEPSPVITGYASPPPTHAEVAPPARPPVAVTPKPRKAAVAAAPVAPPPPPVVVAEAAPPPPAPPANPQTACEGRNFIAMALCMAEQCGKAEFKATAQCEAVRAQQRIEDEKRNPSLIN